MPDRVLQDIPFSGLIHRGKESLAREYTAAIVRIAQGGAISEEFDARMPSTISVEVDNNMDGTHLAVYGSYMSGAPKRPLYGPNGNLLIVTAGDGLVTLPADIFPVGYLALASCSDVNGTLQVENADRLYVMMADADVYSKPDDFFAGYKTKVMGYDPIAYWMLGENSGTTARCEINALQNGTHSVSSLGNTGIGDGRTCPEYDGTNDYTNIYTATLNGNFNGQQGSLIAWAKVINVGVWTDGTDRAVAGLYVDANNYLRIYRQGGVNNQIIYRYRAGGTTETIALGGLAEIGWMQLGISWDLSAGVNGEFKAFYSGIQTGTTQTVLGTWAGNLANTTCTIGAVSTVPTLQWSGYIAHVALFDLVLGDADWQNLANV